MGNEKLFEKILLKESSPTQRAQMATDSICKLLFGSDYDDDSKFGEFEGDFEDISSDMQDLFFAGLDEDSINNIVDSIVSEYGCTQDEYQEILNIIQDCSQYLP